MKQKLVLLKKYVKDRRALYYYLNKSIRNRDIRHVLYLLVRSMLPKVAPSDVVEEEVACLKKDGIIIWEQLLDPTTVNKIFQYLLTKPVYNQAAEFDRKAQTPINLNDIKITKQTKFKYFDTDIATCKEIVELVNSKKILSIVSEYLGCKPTIVTMMAMLTKAGIEPSELFYDDMFHRDVDDYKFIKLFVYLNDVEVNNGAHSFVKGSHLSNKCTQRRTFSDEEIDINFDKKDQLIITGKSGCGFLEDSWGLHRSRPCVQGERLILGFLYSLTAFNAQTTPKPVAKNIYNVDAYSNRVYLHP